jgi:hypothetical protein
MKGYDKDVQAEADRWGYVAIRAKKHTFWRHPNGATVTTSTSPSDGMVLKKIAGDFRREYLMREQNRKAA